MLKIPTPMRGWIMRFVRLCHRGGINVLSVDLSQGAGINLNRGYCLQYVHDARNNQYG